MADIFLSYRRSDAPGFAGRLAEDLEAALGRGSVFRDVDDIRPGEDFVGVIQRELATVGVALIMIGPAWLTASAEVQVKYKRRLDDPEDYVRLEILAALASSKPVIPLLVNGAVMPSETDLPEALRALARHQAFTLTDANWKADVVRLLADVRPLLPRRADIWRRPWPWLVGAGVALALAITWFSGEPTPPISAEPEVTLPIPAKPEARAPAPTRSEAAPVTPPRPGSAVPSSTGRWTATVKYDWGAEHPETFEFQVRDSQVRGSASFLRLPRGIEDGRQEGRHLSFVTHSDEVMGDSPTREVTHRYQGEVKTKTIHFTLESSGGYSRHPPLEFTAHRVGE